MNVTSTPARFKDIRIKLYSVLQQRLHLTFYFNSSACISVVVLHETGNL